MQARMMTDGSVVIQMTEAEAESVLNDLRIIRDDDPDTIGATLDRLIDEIDSVVDDGSADDDDFDDDDDLDDDDEEDSEEIQS